MPPVVRPFRLQDAPALEAVLRANGQLSHPEVEGREAMARVAACDAAVFLVAEERGEPVGLVRGVYDGSRAVLHLLSVRPDRQGRGIGRRLAAACLEEFARRGAPTAGVTATEDSRAFWEGLGFSRLPVFLMLTDLP